MPQITEYPVTVHGRVVATAESEPVAVAFVALLTDAGNADGLTLEGDVSYSPETREVEDG